MADQIKMDYAMMDEMKQSFLKGAETLEEVRHIINEILQSAEEGALLGDGGAAFSEALSTSLAGSVNRMYLKFTELAQDIQGAVDDMRSADDSSAGMMG